MLLGLKNLHTNTAGEGSIPILHVTVLRGTETLGFWLLWTMFLQNWDAPQENSCVTIVNQYSLYNRGIGVDDWRSSQRDATASYGDWELRR